MDANKVFGWVFGLLLVGIILIAVVPNAAQIGQGLQGAAQASSTFYQGFGNAIRGA
jgi:hypothetical protein